MCKQEAIILNCQDKYTATIYTIPRKFFLLFFRFNSRHFVSQKRQLQWMHLAVPRDKIPASRAKNRHISGTAGNFFQILFSPQISNVAQMVRCEFQYLISITCGAKVKKTEKPPPESRFRTNFPEIFRQVGFQSSPTRVKIPERLNRKRQRKIKNEKSCEKYSIYLPCRSFEPVLSLQSCGKIREKFRISKTNENFLKILFSAVA